MGKAARIACIFVPMALTVVALVLLALVGLGQTNSGSQFLSDVYFLRANLTGAASHSDLLHNPKTNETVSGDVDSSGDIILYNSYSIGIWNYCAGGGVVGNETAGNGTDPATSVAFCSPPETQFSFDPEEVWGLTSTFTTKFFSGDLDSALHTYENGLAHAIGPLYIITVALAAASVLVGVGAIFSRIGSIVTTLVSLATTAFSFGFAVVATVAYFGLEGAFNSALDSEGIQVHHGVDAFVFVWLSVACLLVGSLFWAFSSCCVSGKSSHRRDRGVKEIAYGGPASGYQRMEGNAGGYNGAAVPLTSYGQGREQGYEPYRQA